MQNKLYFPKLSRNKNKIHAYKMVDEKVIGSLITEYLLSNLDPLQIITRLDIKIGVRNFFDILDYFGMTRNHQGLMIGYEIDDLIEFISSYETTDKEFYFFRNFINTHKEEIIKYYRLINYVNFENFLANEVKDSLNDNDYRERFYNSFVKIRNSTIQSNFRKRLLNEFQSKCAICNIHNESLLIASHIIPYHMCWEDAVLPEDSENGLLLCVLHDSLFESGRFISFNSNGYILVNPEIRDELNNFGITENTHLNMKTLTDKRSKNLKIHEKLFYSKIGEL